MGKGWHVCACVKGGRQGERASWGFVYDFVRCSFDAFFPPKTLYPFLIVRMCRCREAEVVNVVFGLWL
jgi:hypothetical protein